MGSRIQFKGRGHFDHNKQTSGQKNSEDSEIKSKDKMKELQQISLSSPAYMPWMFLAVSLDLLEKGYKIVRVENLNMCFHS